MVNVGNVGTAHQFEALPSSPGADMRDGSPFCRPFLPQELLALTAGADLGLIPLALAVCCAMRRRISCSSMSPPEYLFLPKIYR